MNDTMKPKKRWFLIAELIVLVFAVVIWSFTSGTVKTVKAEVLKQVIKLDPDNVRFQQK